MTKLNGWLVATLLLGVTAYAIAEEITLTTYYPSPRGVYDQLRTAGDVKIGDISADAPQGRLEIRGSSASGTEKALYVGNADGTPRLVVQNDGAVGLGTESPHTSALLELSSTTKGLLPPRMTTAQRDAIPAPATGLLIYNTDPAVQGYQLYNGAEWKPLGYDQFWKAQGDDIRNTNPGFVGIGTGTSTLGSRLVVQGAGTAARTSSVNVLNSAGASILFVRDDGRVGIKTTAPDTDLDVRGNVKIVDGSQANDRVLKSDSSGKTSWQTSYAVYAP